MFKPWCRQTSFSSTLNLYLLQSCCPVTDTALRPLCDATISLQGSIKRHISAVMHSTEVKQERNYLYKSLHHINHACDLWACPNRRVQANSLSGKMSHMSSAGCNSGNCCRGAELHRAIIPAASTCRADGVHCCMNAMEECCFNMFN